MRQGTPDNMQPTGHPQQRAEPVQQTYLKPKQELSRLLRCKWGRALCPRRELWPAGHWSAPVQAGRAGWCKDANDLHRSQALEGHGSAQWSQQPARQAEVAAVGAEGAPAAEGALVMVEA